LYFIASANFFHNLFLESHLMAFPISSNGQFSILYGPHPFLCVCPIVMRFYGTTNFSNSLLATSICMCVSNCPDGNSPIKSVDHIHIFLFYWLFKFLGLIRLFVLCVFRFMGFFGCSFNVCILCGFGCCLDDFVCLCYSHLSSFFNISRASFGIRDTPGKQMWIDK
jgi:hypothetical protein